MPGVPLGREPDTKPLLEDPMTPPDPRPSVEVLLEEARAGLDRVSPGDLAAEVSAGALVVDIRPGEQRRRDGDLPGAVVVDRNVLEWRLDPTSPHRLGLTDDPDRRVVLVCNEGYSSSLAAATLRRLGLRRATDLVGGFQGWSTLVPVRARQERPAGDQEEQR
jgi:rhodanese-related sulfurtransferase